jgi:glutathione S-transferase
MGVQCTPSESQVRITCKISIDQCSDDFVPTFYQVLTSQEKEPQIKLLSHIRDFNQQLEKSGGPWFMGEQFTLVDISLLVK